MEVKAYLLAADKVNRIKQSILALEIDHENRLSALKQGILALEIDHENSLSALKKSLNAAEEEQRLMGVGLDLRAITIAKNIIYVNGRYTKEGDQESVIDDFLKYFIRGAAVKGDPKICFYGTKNCPPFYSQRADCVYGYKPRHGYINFEVGLNPAWRKHAHLTEDERGACIYYLNNLEIIQNGS